MIILRKLIDKLFTTKTRKDEIDDLLGITEAATMEIMKAIEFYKLGGEGAMIDHWVEVANGKIREPHSAQGTVKFHMGFIGVWDKNDVINLLGQNTYDNLEKSYTNPKGFIEKVKNKLKKQTNQGEEKYDDWLKSNKKFLVSNEDYVTYFRFITLCLAGELDPDFYEGGNEWRITSISGDKRDIDKRKILKNPKINLTKDQTKQLLRKCVDIIVVNVDYPTEK